MNSESTHVNSNIHYTKEYKRKLIIGKVIEIAFWAIILIIAAWVSLIMYKAPVKTTSGTIYPSTKVPNTNTSVIVLPNKDNAIGRLENGMVTHKVQRGKVIVGNYGTLINTGGIYSVNQNGKTIKTSIKVDNPNKKYLDNEYVVKLNSGKEIIVSGDLIKSLQ